MTEPPADHPIPDDLLDAVDSVLTGRGGDDRRALHALAEWADGKLIDPSTWTRVTARQVDDTLVPLYTLMREDHRYFVDVELTEEELDAWLTREDP